MITEIPKVIRLEPASLCNLACSHCPTGLVDMERGVLAEDVYASFLKELNENKEHISVVVLYHGGEPLLSKYFFELIREIKSIKKEIFIKTVSNGMALNDLNAQKILSSELDSIEFSLDGESPEDNEKIRLKSSTSKVLSNIDNLLKIREKRKSAIQVHISTTQFLKESEVPGAVPVIPNWLRSIFENRVNSIKSTYALRWPHMGKHQYREVTFGGETKNYCDHVINTMTIRANGDVVPCCYDLTSKLVMGNIKDEKLKSIWSGEKYSKLRDSIESKNPCGICMKCAVIAPPVYLTK